MSTLASDHLGICTMLYTEDLPPVQHQPRWLLNRADWPSFKRKVTSLLSDTEMPSDVNEMAIKLTDIPTRAANDHIPKSSINTKKRMYWCYDPIIQTAKLLLNRDIRRYKKEKSDSNKQSMREAEEAYAITYNTAKNSHWNQWVSEANDCISPTQLWRKIKKSYRHRSNVSTSPGPHFRK